jgi:hypothetical protein
MTRIAIRKAGYREVMRKLAHTANETAKNNGASLPIDTVQKCRPGRNINAVKYSGIW